ncbi:hypothetical protein MKW98_004772 [Papaver atlanticum]|uniref:Uncharacterized protein n=1 Tax=Papaver atlanticum TaxID=357466 RepID=A0AAD4SRC5_9MAGN|nr:hypothetical protein MKW98_004772 [Papaver atlanticum]
MVSYFGISIFSNFLKYVTCSKEIVETLIHKIQALVSIPTKISRPGVCITKVKLVTGFIVPLEAIGCEVVQTASGGSMLGVHGIDEIDRRLKNPEIFGGPSIDFFSVHPGGFVVAEMRSQRRTKMVLKLAVDMEKGMLNRSLIYRTSPHMH